MNEIELVWDAECSVAESPVFDSRSNRIHFADQLGGRILSFGVSDGSREIWQLPTRVGSLGACRSGRIIVALERTVILFDPATGKIEQLTAEIDEPAGNRFNDGKIGPDGCFWVGTRDSRRDLGAVPDGNACLYRIDPDGAMERKTQGMATSNGLAWSADAKTMYYSDCPNGIVDAWDFDAATGIISNRRRFLTLSPSEGRPDGAACDREGNYWSAGVSAGVLNAYSPAAELIAKIKMPCPGPTMPCFAGDTLYVTSTRRDPSKPGYLPELNEEDISGYPLNVSGLFRLPAPASGVNIGCFADQ